MSDLELAAFGVLWLIAALLAGLVLLLYRQIEKAYRLQGAQAGGLLPGVEAPALEILSDEGIVPLLLPENGELTVLAFLSTACDSCTKLVRVLENDRLVETPVIALVSGETRRDTVIPDNPRVQMHWLAHPPDAVSRYGASVTPFVYLLRDRTVLASKAVSTHKALASLIEEALANEQQLHAPEPHPSVLAEAT